jgi:hypothetical protein
MLFATNKILERSRSYWLVLLALFSTLKNVLEKMLDRSERSCFPWTISKVVIIPDSLHKMKKYIMSSRWIYRGGKKGEGYPGTN